LASAITRAKGIEDLAEQLPRDRSLNGGLQQLAAVDPLLDRAQLLDLVVDLGVLEHLGRRLGHVVFARRLEDARAAVGEPVRGLEARVDLFEIGLQRPT
jgi:hypothetical protein